MQRFISWIEVVRDSGIVYLCITDRQMFTGRVHVEFEGVPHPVFGQASRS